MDKEGYKTFIRRFTAAAAVAVLVVIAAHSSTAYAGSVVVADDDSYYNEVVRSELPVILEFSASWCGYCKKMIPTMNQMANELSGKVKVVTVDIDNSPETKSRFKVRSVPSFFYMEDGNVRGEALGAYPKETLLMKLNVPGEYWK